MNVKNESSHLNVKMKVHYSGFFRISIINASENKAIGCNLRIETWAEGAPAEDLLINELFPDLIPGADWIYDIDIFKARRKHSGETGRVRSSIFGYIVISCENFHLPLAWTFYIPKENEWPDYNWDNIPFIKFEYKNMPRQNIESIWNVQLSNN